MLPDELNVSLYVRRLLSESNIRRTCTTLRKGSALRWTAYMNECLRILEIENELESDAVLVQLVKVRLLTGRVIELPWLSHVAETDTFPRVPAMFYLNSLEAQLQDFKSKVPSNLSNNSKSNSNVGK